MVQREIFLFDSVSSPGASLWGGAPPEMQMDESPGQSRRVRGQTGTVHSRQPGSPFLTWAERVSVRVNELEIRGSQERLMVSSKLIKGLIRAI